MDKTYKAPQGRLITTIIIFVFIVAVIFTLFLWFQNMSANRELTRIEDEMTQVATDIQILKDDQVQELVSAQAVIDTVESREITWSKVIRKLEDNTPLGVFFRTYTGSDTGNIEITALGDGYVNVADVIKMLVDSDDFEDVFVPSVALGTTTDGQSVVSFGLQVKYIKE